ncbi:MAG: cofactor-independent phosphoglycerate mutase [Anaerovoracaceae bacterium]|jgi:2,3-bisphosphoglycerate-independent phosphoglycerate mutase
MKYWILLTDGAGDEKIESLGNKTPLEVAEMKNINGLARRGTVGMVRTIPHGIAPGSDAANLSVMGYDPRKYHTGRSPLEAASIGVDLADTDVAFRCNLVTLAGDGSYEDLTVADHSSGEITTEEADVLIKDIQKAFGSSRINFYTGTSYRHAMIVNDGETHYDLTPPHDILDRRVGDYLPKGQGVDFIYNMMKESYNILKDHPINIRRREKGLNPANSIWIWGQGKKPALTSFFEKYGVKGTAISAVDLIKGIGICAGLDTVDVPGATGTINTNYEGKARATIEEFKRGQDFVYLHMEGPDECSHQGDLAGKIKCLEIIDREIAGPVIEYLEGTGEDYKILVLPDHQTPMHIRTHSPDPVPFVLFDSRDIKADDGLKQYGETAASSGPFFENGYQLADYFFIGQ